MIEKRVFKTEAEWLTARKNYIGGSEAASIVGLNPYKTNVELWREKVGISDPEDISEKPYIKYGHAAEPLLRELFKLDFPQYDVRHDDFAFYVNSDFPFAHASLDGELIDKDGRRGILEIKTTNIMQSRQFEKWDDKIPDNYYCQILWYLMVTGWDFVILKALLRYQFSDGLTQSVRHYHFDRAEVETDIGYLATRGKEFYGNIVSKKEPALILPEI